MGKWLKIIAFSFLIFILADKAKAQQEQSFMHFMLQQATYNPAVSGNEQNIQFNGLMRQQWVGLSGAPQTYLINIHAPVAMLNGGVGASIINDQIAAFKTTGLKLAYAYRKEFWQGDISFGLSAGLINQSINYAYFNVQDDPLLQGSNDASGMIFNLDLGVFYEEKGHYYLGLSSTQVNQGSMTIDGGATSLKRNIYLHGGYYFTMRQLPDIVFHSSAMAVYTAGAPLQINLGMLAEYNKKFWGGVIYRHQSGLGLMAGIYYKQFTASYAYEINTTSLSNGGSHELMVGYRFKIEIVKGNKSYKNTRYL